MSPLPPFQNAAHPQFSLAISSDPDPDELLFARQLGVECAYTWVNDEQTSAEYLTGLRQRVEDAGLTLYMTGNMNLGKSDRIHLALPGRDEKIAEYQAFIRNLGKAGIHTTTFTWEPDRVWSSAPEKSRDAQARAVHLDEMLQRPLTHGRVYSEDEIWDNYTYFIRRILPVAEDSGVRLALHPNDPPTPHLGGIPCLIHRFEDYQRAFEIGNSPYLGMEFCCGCWLEGGAAFGDIFEAIRHFQAQGKIFIVHFRNVSAPLPDFVETFLDNGYMDMYRLMKTFVESGYNGTMTLDHTPQFVSRYPGAGPAYAIGYMRALLQRAQAEVQQARAV
jgi:mannonate dehydratase